MNGELSGPYVEWIEPDRRMPSAVVIGADDREPPKTADADAPLPEYSGEEELMNRRIAAGRDRDRRAARRRRAR
jgi:hypothetical protein